MLPSVKAIAFDCFGTLVEVTAPSHVYRSLVERLPVQSQHSAQLAVMSTPWSLSESVGQMRLGINSFELAELERRLTVELGSIACFQETRVVLAALRARGYHIALCSNLALPYAAPVEALIGDLLDVRTWSFAVGSTKPDARIYTALCAGLSLLPSEVLMVGDSFRCDVAGPRASGLLACHLARGSSAPSSPERIENLTGLLEMMPGVAIRTRPF